MEIGRAKAIADVARVLVDSAKAEVEYLKATGGKQGSGFIPAPEQVETVPHRARLVKGS